MTGFEDWVRGKRDRAELMVSGGAPSVDYWMGQRAAFNWVLFELGARGLRDEE